LVGYSTDSQPGLTVFTYHYDEGRFAVGAYAVDGGHVVKVSSSEAAGAPEVVRMLVPHGDVAAVGMNIGGKSLAVMVFPASSAGDAGDRELARERQRAFVEASDALHEVGEVTLRPLGVHELPSRPGIIDRMTESMLMAAHTALP
jgi:hypothetical protein